MVTPATTPKLPAALTAPPARPGEVKEGQSAEAKLSSDFETFLKMMTTQMENQDPLNPMESTEFAMQLATFSGVEQQVQTNSVLKGMATQLGIMGMTDVAGWVGMEARVVAPAKFDGSPITLHPNPPTTADKVNLVVKDSKGTIVQKTEIARDGAQITWAGVDDDGDPLPKGNYTFELESWSEGKLLDTEKVEVYTRVVETRNDGGNLKLVLESGELVTADAISALRESS